MSATRISPQEANEKVSAGWIYVDVRTTQEFEAGHPAGAVNIPFMHAGDRGMTPNPDFVRVMSAVFPTDAKIIVGCKTGARSLRAAHALEEKGFTSVLEQRAGWDGVRDPFGQLSEPGWSRVGLPIEQGQPSGQSWEDMKRRGEPGLPSNE